ncbi:SGNH/GDSL hydrolase family protein [Paenibacillus eucommiae]|uniref:Lysophospholipase L1-like esterase n=1 Tax=Paenibacillus eucommiae TaxID=1355755 RepID=A0ABS4IWX7_9BACL|nr:SGNH/GDSL hydrolase family protein [Paenibacillus eucommiae]MBP1992088.1 lysophospholipase L1-like esterase [Paenibacillus eucommiae]
MVNPEILLPKEIPAVVGKEINIYFDNLIIEDADRYYVDVICDIGQHQNERWTLIPDAPGEYPLTISLYADTITKLATATTMIKVSGSEAVVDKASDTVSDTASDNARIPESVLFIGDSTTAAGFYTDELLNLFQNDPQSIVLLGTKGTAPNCHEGRGGWRVDSYFSGEESPFVFDKSFNFTRYMGTNGYRDLDYVCIHLGINDVFNKVNDAGVQRVIDEEMPMLEKIIASIQDYNASIQIGLMVAIPPSRFQDSFGSNYGAGQTRWRYKRNIFLWNKELLARFEHRKADGIFMLPINVNLDTVHNMASHSVSANSRCSKQIVRQTDGVHPAEDGYYQMADVIYYGLKNRSQKE